MTGNLTIHDAVCSVICGHIEFSGNLSGERYILRVGGGMSLQPIVRGVAGQSRRVTREEVLSVIRQGDDSSWTWPTFCYAWIGWADGFAKGKQSSYYADCVVRCKNRIRSLEEELRRLKSSVSEIDWEQIEITLRGE